MVVIALGIGVFSALTAQGVFGGGNTKEQIEAGANKAFGGFSFVTGQEVKTYASNQGEQEATAKADSASIVVQVNKLGASEFQQIVDNLPKTSITTLFQIVTDDKTTPSITAGVFTTDFVDEQNTLMVEFGEALTCIAETPDNQENVYQLKAAESSNPEIYQIAVGVDLKFATSKTIQKATDCFVKAEMQTTVINQLDNDRNNAIRYNLVNGKDTYLTEVSNFADAFALNFLGEGTAILMDANLETGEVMVTVTSLGSENTPESVQTFVDKYTDLKITIQDAITLDEEGNPVE